MPEDEGIIAATTDYAINFTSMVWKDNIFAMQFHPEKSQELGLKILKGYGDFVKRHSYKFPSIILAIALRNAVSFSSVCACTDLS